MWRATSADESSGQRMRHEEEAMTFTTLSPELTARLVRMEQQDDERRGSRHYRQLRELGRGRRRSQR